MIKSLQLYDPKSDAGCEYGWIIEHCYSYIIDKNPHLKPCLKSDCLDEGCISYDCLCENDNIDKEITNHFNNYLHYIKNIDISGLKSKQHLIETIIEIDSNFAYSH